MAGKEPSLLDTGRMKVAHNISTAWWCCLLS